MQGVNSLRWEKEIAKYIPHAIIQSRRTDLESIANTIVDEKIADDIFFACEENPTQALDVLVEMNQRYGLDVAGLYERFAGDVLEFEPKHRNIFEFIAENAHEESIARAFQSLPPEHFLDKIHDHIRHLVTATGENVHEALANIPAAFFIMFSEEARAFVEKYGPASGSRFSQNTPQIEPEQCDKDFVLKLHEATGGEFNKSFEAYARAKSKLESMGLQLEQFKDTLYDIAKHTSVHAPQALEGASGFLSNSYDIHELLIKIAQVSGRKTLRAYQHLLLPQAVNRTQEMIDFFNEYKDAAWGLLAAFEGDILKETKHRKPTINEIIRNATHGAGEFFATIPPHQWRGRQQDLARNFRHAAARVHRQLGDHAHHFSYHQRKTLQRAQDELGILNIQRYIPYKTTNIGILEQALLNLDPDYNKDRPVTLWLSAGNDHNSALDSWDRLMTLATLTQQHKLLVFEVNTTDDVTRAIETTQQALASSTEQNEGVIDYLFIDSHGGPGIVTWEPIPYEKRLQAEKGEQQPEYTSSAHRPAFEKWSPCIARDGQIYLVSCYTAMDLPKQMSVQQAIKQSIPHAQVTASNAAIVLHGVDLDSKQKIIRIRCDPQDSLITF